MHSPYHASSPVIIDTFATEDSVNSHIKYFWLVGMKSTNDNLLSLSLFTGSRILLVIS
jgi:hypothetical protein